MSIKVILLVDYRSYFYSSVRSRGASIDLHLLKNYMHENGCELVLQRFPDIDFRTNNFHGQYVMYQSSEDRGLYYKDYIEDILLALNFQGAMLIPDFYKFRAHHNKVFMEFMRDLSGCNEIKNIRTKNYGTKEDFEAEIHLNQPPKVLKTASGALSAGVRLASTMIEMKKSVSILSRTFNLMDYLKNMVNTLIRKNYTPKSGHRRKFIVQNFVEGLQGDYKILVYGNKYYVLYRMTRKNDFRASGSGKFAFLKTLPDGLLDFAKMVYDSFDVPFISIDIACSQGVFYLLEFQFLSFGTYTIEKSEFYFQKTNMDWVIVDETPVVEREIAHSVAQYIRRLESRQGQE